jgi:transposase-like protein
MGRRNFTREFKLEAVKLVKERGVSVSQVARDLDIGASVIGRWVRENQADKRLVGTAIHLPPKPASSIPAAFTCAVRCGILIEAHAAH